MTDPATEAMAFWMRSAKQRLSALKNRLQAIKRQVYSAETHIHNRHVHDCEDCDGNNGFYGILQDAGKMIVEEIKDIEEFLDG